MHAGLLRPDSVEAEAAGEVRQVAGELAAVAGATTTKAPVALLFDYEAIWASQIQPQGKDYRGLELLIHFYSAARRLGLSVDVVHPSADLSGYHLIFCPLQIFWPEGLSAKIKASGAVCVLGPRTGSKTDDFQIPANLAPGLAQELIPLVVGRVESLRPGHAEQAGPYKVRRWLEHIQSDLVPEAYTASGHGIWYHTDKVDYLACWPEAELLDAVLRRRCEALGLATLSLPDGLRLRQRGAFMFAINYEAEPLDLCDHILGADSLDYVIGGPDLPPAGVAAWRIN
jgi:beta-galactosidase